MSAMGLMPRVTDDWTVRDLESLPDDGLRYELIDGGLSVSPAPTPLHQRVVRELFVLLQASCPAEYEVFFAPIDFRPNERTSLQPDLLVARRADIGEQVVTAAVLAVEVLSTSSRRRDLELKRSVYQDSAVDSYWVVSPENPEMWAWDLVDGKYVDVGHIIGDQSLRLLKPFTVTVNPATLVAG